MSNKNNNQPNQFLRFLAAVIATADDQKPQSRQQRMNKTEPAP